MRFHVKVRTKFPVPTQPETFRHPRSNSMTAPFEVDFSTLPLALRYKLLAALVVPRPIALVTTVGKDGVVNAAPFSFLGLQGIEWVDLGDHSGGSMQVRTLR